MYVHTNLGDLGARKTPLEILQGRLAALQKRLAKEQADLTKATTPQKIHKWQAQIDETNKKIADIQTQIAALQAGAPPIVPPSTTTTGTVPATPTSPSADVTQLIPVSSSLDYSASSGAVPTSGTSAAPLVPISDWLSNPWILGGGVLLLFLIFGKRGSA